MIAADADCVEPGHISGAMADDIGHNAHGWRRRINVGVASEIFFEDVVLNGAVQLFLGHPLLFGGNDVHGHNGNDGTVHGHGDRHLVQGNPVKKDLHILHRVDGHAGLAHIPHDPGMIGIITAVGGQIKGHRKPLLTGGQVAAVKGIGRLGG